MIDSMNMSPPAGERVQQEPVIPSQRWRVVANIMVRRAHKALDNHKKLDDRVTKLFMSKLTPRERTKVMDLLEEQRFEVLRPGAVAGDCDEFVLRRDEGELTFAITPAPTN